MNMNDFQANVKLNLNQVDLILGKLYDAPYREAADTIFAIRQQVEQQIQAAQQTYAERTVEAPAQ